MAASPERWRTELRWAWRNVRARGWRAGLAVALLAVALAANTLVFSASDSLVFRRVAYPEAHRLIGFQERDARTGRLSSPYASPAVLDEWRKQEDLFAGVQGHLHKVIFLSGAGEPELVQTSDVTVGLIELLGVGPRWGRSLVEGDDRRTDLQAVLIAESLARERFGNPERAIGQTLETTAEPLNVVGVMPESFRFPRGTQRIWRAFHPRGALAQNTSITLIARVAPGVSLDQLARTMEQRSADVLAAAGARAGTFAVPAPLTGVQSPAEQRRMLLVLIGAALSLLFIACANAASLELAGALGRARTYAIQLAVGASRGSLARTSLIEGIWLAGAAAVAAASLTYLGIQSLVRMLPPAVSAGSVNPIDLDERALLFMTALTAVTWILSSAPVVAFAWRANLLDLLKLEGNSVAASRGGALVRRALTVAQVALAVLLLVGSVLYVRSYLVLLRLDKGFDSSGVVAITLTIPPQLLGTPADRRVLTQTILERLRARPGVIAAFEGSPPPSTGDSPNQIDSIEVDDRPPMETNLAFPRLWVEPDYFEVLRIPLLAGRMFEPGEPRTNVIITEALGRRLWPGTNAVGHRFRETPNRPWNHVIGVVGHVRALRDGTTGPDQEFQLYVARQLPPPPVARAQPSRPARMTGVSYGFLTVTARVDSRSRTNDLYQTVRSVDSRNILKLEFVDDQYARQFANRLLATRVISSFGVLAFLVAAAGIYGLMAFLVADRAREIGIRMALGADTQRISRLVLGSSLRLVTLGAVLGIGGAIATSRWAESQLFGVRATDPLTIAMVTLGVVATALLATWHPARQAARIDPKVLLKN